ncbi:xylosidase [Xanthomonas oryzae pv. oryzae]|nr:xylosidase [Xanthomonas oryzae pv. oryzae]
MTVTTTTSPRLHRRTPSSSGFRAATLGPQWAFFNPAADEAKCLQLGNGVLRLQGKGSAPRHALPLTVIATAPAYQFEVQMTVAPGRQSGARLFYSDKLYAGVGSNGEHFVMHRYGGNAPARWPPVLPVLPCGCGSPTTATSSPSTAVPAARSGPRTRCRWKYPATTTTWPASSWP